MKRNVFSFCNGGIISENTVNSLIFTEMQVIVRVFYKKKELCDSGLSLGDGRDARETA